jgi:hypothetical protein
MLIRSLVAVLKQSGNWKNIEPFPVQSSIENK